MIIYCVWSPHYDTEDIWGFYSTHWRATAKREQLIEDAMQTMPAWGEEYKDQEYWVKHYRIKEVEVQ